MLPFFYEILVIKYVVIYQIFKTVKKKNVSRSADLSRDDTLLFSESPSRFLVEVRSRDVDRFEELMEGVPCSPIGEVISGKDFIIRGQDGNKLVHLTLGEMKEAWKKPLQW